MKYFLFQSADAMGQVEGKTWCAVIARHIRALRGRGAWHVRKHLTREPGDPETGLGGWRPEVRVENLRSTSAMNGIGKSDSLIVPEKLSNKGGGALRSAEKVEGRGLTEGNLFSETSSGLWAGEDLHSELIGYGKQSVGYA